MNAEILKKKFESWLEMASYKIKSVPHFKGDLIIIFDEIDLIRNKNNK